MNIKKILVGSVASVIMFGAAVFPAFAANFFNGFETDTAGWFPNGAGTITRVASGTNGITSADGSYHAEVVVGPDFNGVFTRWGGYEGTFPTNGYVTKVDVYIDMAENPTIGTDKRFDFSSAINTTDPNVHRRDFIFHLGTDPLVAGQWKASVSNNAPGWPSNPARSPIIITDSGWYTLRSTFQDNGSGVLEVVMDILDSSDAVIGSWTLSDPTDVIGVTVGGNRYGWFVTSDFGFLAIDNSEKRDIVPVVGPPTNKDQCKKDGWKTFNNPSFKNQGQCVSYTNHN